MFYLELPSLALSVYHNTITKKKNFLNPQLAYYHRFSPIFFLGDILSADVFKGPYNATEFEPIPLEYLNLAYNQIHSLHKNIFEHTPHLKHLNLEGNDFRVLDDMTALAFTLIPQLKVRIYAKYEFKNSFNSFIR